jgi:hypothetical protein
MIDVETGIVLGREFAGKRAMVAPYVQDSAPQLWQNRAFARSFKPRREQATFLEHL